MVIDVNCTPVFWANRDAYYKHQYRVIGNQGSTRSSKTYSLCQLMVDIATTTKKEISIVSPSLPHSKKGARKDTIQVLENLGLFNENDFNRTDQVYHFPSTGSYIEFFGVEDSKKVRGPGRQILYINEANLLSHEIYIQLALRTTETIFLDFNPADEYSWVYPVVDKPSNKLIVSTYKNNLANLTREQIDEIESLRDIDDNLWKVFALGQRGTSSETIYTHWGMCKKLPDEGERFYGQDFGFNVASALIDIEYYENELYWDQVIYESKLTTNDLIEKYKINNVSKIRPIYCDNAEPKTIEEICRAGYNAMPADKDVTEGIRFCKGKKLWITERSVETLKEARSYKWKINKDGHVLDEPVKFNDHAMDAGRYGSFTHLSTPQLSWIAM